MVLLKVNGKRNEVEVAPDTPLLFRLLPAKRSRRSRISPPQTWASSCSVPGSPRTRLKSDQVKLHTMLLGGGFGRRGVLDSHFVREAAQISKAVKAPVKVVWMREDDIRGGYYRPAAFYSIAAGLDGTGNPVAWRHRIVCQSFMVDTPFEGAMVKDGLDLVAAATLFPKGKSTKR